VQVNVPAASADYKQFTKRFVADLGHLLQNLRVSMRQTVKDQVRKLRSHAGVSRDFLIFVVAQHGIDPIRHAMTEQQPRIIDGQQMAGRIEPSARTHQRAKVPHGMLFTPTALTLLDQPHAVDVFQEPYRAAEPSLVTEVVPVSGVAETGLRQYSSDEGPGSRADERPVIALIRDSGHRGRGVMTGRCYQFG